MAGGMTGDSVHEHLATSGPWEVKGALGEGIRIVAKDQRRTIVAYIAGAWGNPTAQADAHIIAAAPDLLEALEEFVERLQDIGMQMGGEFAVATAENRLWRKALAAIDKARAKGA